MRYRLLYTLPSFLLTSGLTIGCAGPTTPFGALWSVTVPDAHSTAFLNSSPDPSNPSQAATGPAPKIEISPKRQVLHSAREVSFSVEDSVIIPAETKPLSIYYNGFEVTDSFLRQAS